MKPQNATVMALATVLVLGGLGFGLYFLVQAFGFLVEYLDSEVSSMAIVGCATLLLCSVMIARGLSRRPVAPDSGPSAKEALYDRALSVWSKTCRHSRQPGGEEFDELERLLVLRASKSVLNCHLRLRGLAPPLDPSGGPTRAALQQLIAEIRKDLGHRELPWSSAALVDHLFRRGEPSETATPGSGEFKVMREQ